MRRTNMGTWCGSRTRYQNHGYFAIKSILRRRGRPPRLSRQLSYPQMMRWSQVVYWHHRRSILSTARREQHHHHHRIHMIETIWTVIIQTRLSAASTARRIVMRVIILKQRRRSVWITTASCVIQPSHDKRRHISMKRCIQIAPNTSWQTNHTKNRLDTTTASIVRACHQTHLHVPPWPPIILLIMLWITRRSNTRQGRAWTWSRRKVIIVLPWTPSRHMVACRCMTSSCQ